MLPCDSGYERWKVCQGSSLENGIRDLLAAWPLRFRAASAVRCSKADLLIAHSEQALWALSHLPPLTSRLAVDMEDWFSEDLPPETRRHRPVKLLRDLEREVLRSASHAACTSLAMSEAMAAEYGCRAPAVVYNAFPWADRVAIDGKIEDRRDRSVPSVHWYSQTLGTDRGLQDLFNALPLVKHEAEIHLRGKLTTGFKEWMAEQVPEHWCARLFVHEVVSNEELLSRIAEHDIGFAGEMRYCKSKELTVSNKILHYLLGGLAVIASDTAGQRKSQLKRVRQYVFTRPEVRLWWRRA